MPVPGPPSIRIKSEYSNNPNILFKSFSFLNFDLLKLCLIFFESFCSISSNLLFHFIQDNFEFLNIIGEFIDSINPDSLKAFKCKSGHPFLSNSKSVILLLISTNVFPSFSDSNKI